MNDALQKACLKAGGQNRLAFLLGIPQSKVWYWLKRSKRGAAGEYVLEIERHTGVSRHVLRPDLYPINAPSIPASGDTAARASASSDDPTSETLKSPSAVAARAGAVPRRRRASGVPA